MEAIARIESRVVREVWDPTYGAFLPLLETKRAEIESIKRETYQYGKTERHKLDVYYPPSPPSNTKLPIIFFSYLGGLEFGDRILPESNGLVYPNLGAFFSKQNFVTVVADYRLVPTHAGSAVYPDCLYDVLSALEFIASPSSAISDNTLFASLADVNYIYILGHSAGALNQSSLILNPSIFPLSHPIRSKIKGAIWNGGAYHFDNAYSGMPLEEYYGPTSSNGHLLHSSFGLLRAAPDEIVSALPPLLIVSAEWESDGLKKMVEDFVRVLKERGVKELTEYLNKGHNHISSYLSLMSGEGEDWGYEVVDWIQSFETIRSQSLEDLI